MDIGSADSTFAKQKERRQSLINEGMKLRRRTILPILSINRKHPNRTLMPHPLLGNAHDLFPVRREIHPLHRRRELPRVQAFPVGDLPELEGVVGRAGDEVFRFDFSQHQQRIKRVRRRRRTINIDRPNRPVMPIVRSQSLAIAVKPHADVVVFGT